MAAGRDTEEFQQFFQRLIRPTAPIQPEALPATITHVTVNGPLRCKIYIGVPAVAEPRESTGPDSPPTQP